MQKFNRNNIDILIESTPKTPRMCVSFFFKIQNSEKYYGTNSLLARLLLQGTKKYSSLELSEKFERECIDVSSKAKQDFIKVSLVFLNEDFNLAMELASDIILNSTFDSIDKEIHKIKGETISELDSPRVKLTDYFIKTIYNNHPYSSTLTRILEDIDKIQKEDIIKAHKDMLNSPKAIVIAGDIKNEDSLLNYFEKEFSFMKNGDLKDSVENIFKSEITSDTTHFIEKNDASQAQIIQGVLTESFNSELCAKYTVLNNILGSSGLSSRLFVNLRDKQGLAYTVRSQYETMLHSAIFSMYIATAPKNIQKALNGFYEELKKLADTKVTEKELKGAKENISGRLKYFTQNNAQIVALKGYNYIMGLGIDYFDIFLDDINNVSADDVCNMAQKIIQMPKLNIVLAPKEYKL